MLHRTLELNHTKFQQIHNKYPFEGNLKVKADPELSVGAANPVQI